MTNATMLPQTSFHDEGNKPVQSTPHAHTDYFREHPCLVYWGYMGVTALIVSILCAITWAGWVWTR